MKNAVRTAVLSALLAVAVFAAAPGDASPAAPGTSSEALRTLVTSGTDADLRWPDFSDYRDQAAAFRMPGEGIRAVAS